MNIITALLPNATQRRSGQKNTGIKFLVAHDTGNPGSTAHQNIDYYIKSANDVQASAHFFVDDIGIYNCIPEDEKAWHVRSNVGIDKKHFGVFANDAALGIELCFGTTWGALKNNLAYENYVNLFAHLCNKYNINPTSGIVGHGDLDPTRRTDPYNAFKIMGKTFNKFISDVQAAVGHTEVKPGITPAFARNMVYGAKGDDVALLQQFLGKIGLYTYPTVTGQFFDITKTALVKFQKKYGLPPTGVFDDTTRLLANKMVECAEVAL